MMKFLLATAAALSIAAVAAIATPSNPSATDPSSDAAITSGKPAQLILAGGRYRRCQESLGYGRTGSYGCG
jgi:hypothetical protein